MIITRRWFRWTINTLQWDESCGAARDQAKQLIPFTGEHFFICSFDKYILSVQHVQGMALGAADTVVNETKSWLPWSLQPQMWLSEGPGDGEIILYYVDGPSLITEILKSGNCCGLRCNTLALKLEEGAILQRIWAEKVRKHSALQSPERNAVLPVSWF